ncbi:hypothetical protein ACFW04_002357 [Cataglyphis niger]
MSDKLAESIEDDNSVTMLDVLQVENQLEEDAYAVLGASDDQNCTYNKGYIRQALYACKTCCSDKIRAAVCLACSFHCHEGHELVELYTKRHFRCDCGNSKFDGKQCNLEKLKSAVNIENKYNQNFDGVYCTCARPYPDPEGDEDDMFQCTICEDWYHLKLYTAKGIAFLLDLKDSVQAYEEAGKMNKQESQYEKGMKALASMGHVQKLTAIEEYNNMKERLMQYLQKFAENKKVVREEDIKEFFSEMESKKRPKVTVPTYCR